MIYRNNFPASACDNAAGSELDPFPANDEEIDFDFTSDTTEPEESGQDN